MPDDGSQKPPPDAERPPKLSTTVLDDLTRGDFQHSMRRDLEDIYQFYLEEEDREKLAEMGQFSRWLYLLSWTLKSSILRLPPARRLLLLGGIFFFGYGLLLAANAGWTLLGFLLLLLILVLELKDKLLAQNELETGRVVQFALMPRENPRLPGWETWLFTRPANEVGGDLVDYLLIDKDRLGLALGDVAGKGLGAALFMAKLQATLRALAPTYSSLSDLGTQINDIFRRDGLPSRFVSLVYLEVEPNKGHVRLLNAGHPPPILIGKDGIEELPRGSTALGLMADADYNEQVVDLQPGEFLLLYSDGLTEARNSEGTFFDDDRLLKLLPNLRGRTAKAAGARLLAEVDRFVGEARPNDDLSIVLLHRLPDAPDRPKALPAPSLQADAS